MNEYIGEASNDLPKKNNRKYNFPFHLITPTASCWINKSEVKITVLRTMVVRWNKKNSDRPLTVVTHSDKFEVKANLIVGTVENV